MSEKAMEFAERTLVAVSETYRTGDMGPWRRHVEATFDPDIVLETSEQAFTEGEWRGHEGAVGFVANQMEVLDEMWVRVDEYFTSMTSCWWWPSRSVGERSTRASRSNCTRSTSSG